MRVDMPASAFTLIELLVAVTLIVGVAVVATTSVMQMMKLTRRLQAVQNMNAAATTVQAKLGDEVAGMHPGSAIWLRTTDNATDPTLKDVELVFMTAQRAPHNYRGIPLADYQSREIGYCDLVWTRWAWNASSEVLSASNSRNARWTRIFGDATRNYWKLPAAATFTSRTMSQLNSIPGERNLPFFSVFLSIPRPVRETGVVGAVNVPNGILDRNTWNWPPDPNFESAEMGDYTDLVRNARPVLRGCSALRLEVVLRDGSREVADQSTSLTWAAPGDFIDGGERRDTSNALRFNPDDRPSLVRIAFTLREGDTPHDRDGSLPSGSDIRPSQSYSFSMTTLQTPTY